MNRFPDDHAGINYLHFMSQLSRKRDTKRYLEIGVRYGETFASVSADIAVGVDPDFAIKHNVSASKKRVSLLSMTSDAFFSDQDATGLLGGHPDLTFLDMMHVFEYLLRDFYNAESLSGPRSLIAMHDCLPLNEEMADRDMNISFARGKDSRHPLAWTGDVWKIIPILQKYRPDLKLVFVDCPPTGLLFVTNLDPRNRILQENYLKIVEEFSSIENTESNILEMYSSIKVTSSAAVLNEFDHSLYFSI